MSYVDGMVAAVPTASKETYIAYSKQMLAVFKDYGVTSYVETWGNDVPEGKHTDFYRAVQAKPDETIVFSWVGWPDKATRDAAWEKLMQDPRMQNSDMPFDGKRMIYGGFDVVVEL